VEPRGERCYSSKESYLQGMASHRGGSRGGDWGDRPPKTSESNIFQHDFAQFRKTLGCQRRLDCQILLKSTPPKLTSWICPWLHIKADSSMHSRYAEARKSAALTVKSPKCNLERISDINWIPITGKQTRRSGKQSGAKDLILLDPSKTKMVSYSAMKKTSMVDGESILKIS